MKSYVRYQQTSWVTNQSTSAHHRFTVSQHGRDRIDVPQVRERYLQPRTGQGADDKGMERVPHGDFLTCMRMHAEASPASKVRTMHAFFVDQSQKTLGLHLRTTSEDGIDPCRSPRQYRRNGEKVGISKKCARLGAIVSTASRSSLF